VGNKDLGITEADEFLRRGLDELLDLDEARLERLGLSLARPDSEIPESLAELKRVCAETGIDSPLLYRTIPVVRFLLSGWSRAGFNLDQVLEDLKRAGVSEERVKRSRHLLAPLEGAKERFLFESLKSRAEMVGGPTVDDLDLIWDVRPIFDSSLYTSDSDEEDGAEWVGLTYVLLMEISASRRDGQQESTTLQLSEREFNELETAIFRARRQLEVLKGKKFS
jgi:hypothetical protein